MADTVPTLCFISLFVPDLDAAVKTYTVLLRRAPSDTPGTAPVPHPFASKGPVVFDLGGLSLALYQCDTKTTHPGDVGFGLQTQLDQAAETVKSQGGQVFWGPRNLGSTSRRMAIGMLRDRHFFELVDDEDC